MRFSNAHSFQMYPESRDGRAQEKAAERLAAQRLQGATRLTTGASQSQENQGVGASVPAT